MKRRRFAFLFFFFFFTHAPWIIPSNKKGKERERRFDARILISKGETGWKIGIIEI